MKPSQNSFTCRLLSAITLMIECFIGGFRPRIRIYKMSLRLVAVNVELYIHVEANQRMREERMASVSVSERGRSKLMTLYYQHVG